MIEMLSLEVFDSNCYFAFSCLMQVMGNSRKSNKVNNSQSKGGKGARRKQQQTAGLVSALARANERVERLKGKKAALEDQNN